MSTERCSTNILYVFLLNKQMEITNYAKQTEYLKFLSDDRINITEFFGLPRSGNHAIIFWHLFNLAVDLRTKNFPKQKTGNTEVISGIMCRESNTIYFNNVNQLIEEVGNCLEKFQLKIDNLIISNEHQFTSCRKNTTKCLIVRDVVNNVCSHYARFSADRNITPKMIERYTDKFVESYKTVIKLFNDADLFAIKYNKWVLDADYRNIISNKLGVHNKDNTSFVSGFGGGSSFTRKNAVTDKSLYLERYKLVQLPTTLRDAIVNDEEIREFNLNHFDMDIKCLI